MEFEVGDVVLCTVERIVGTVVFVKIHNQGEKEGSIIMSEIAPGRIRNLRDYVVPKKKIVCKILRISLNGNIDLSLRRVTLKEKKEVLEKDKQEKGYVSVLKSILKENVEEVTKKILEEDNLFDFFQEAKENSKNLEKIVGKENSKKILDIIKTQKQKKVTIKKEFYLTTKKPDGINSIKKILSPLKKVEIKYISAGRYSMKKESDNPKSADNKIKEALKELEAQSKKHGFEFKVKEK